MTPEETVALNWLDTAPCDMFSFTSFVKILELLFAAKKIVACKALVDAVVKRLRGLLDVLTKLQQQTMKIPDPVLTKEIVGGMHELMKGLVVAAYHLRTYLERFAEEQSLCQLIRNRKLVECIQRAHDAVDEFVFEVRQSRMKDEFNQCAADVGVEVSVLNLSEAHWRDQVGTASQMLLGEMEAHGREAHGPEVCEQRAACQLFKDSRNPEVSSKAELTLAFETKRSCSRGTVNSFIGIVRVAMPAPANEVRVQHWFLPSDSIRLEEKIGSGGCGEVWRGTLDMTTQIVAKRLLVEERESEELTRKKRMAHEREVHVWQHLNHPHILQFYGATAFGADCSIVSELAPHGKLNGFWIKPGGSIDPVRKQEVWRLLFEAALGLQHMHERGFVHGDLKCDNIFVGDDEKAKVADFGLSFQIGDHESVTCTEAANWLAPECMDKEPEVRARTCATDVFMFGMCIVEALRGGPPWGGLGDVSVRYQLKQGNLPIATKSFAPDVQKLVNTMCAFKPEDRISMDTVAGTLKVFDDSRDPQLFVGTLLSDEIEGTSEP